MQLLHTAGLLLNNPGELIPGTFAAADESGTEQLDQQWRHNGDVSPCCCPGLNRGMLA
jgi:hypothetical protein